ncbi:MAG: 4Fe-4S binding protein [Lachnospiraceae bacterium]|nr:4Fe-4S binding protein [Lachnospiraceae bacterium]
MTEQNDSKLKRSRLPFIRRFTQLIAAVLYNCNFRGFADGKIYKGDTKGLCAPGLNCYSCPGAVASCPLGSLQTALVNSRYRAPYYILGTLLLFGLFLGRFICGFLCPFGLIQQLLHKLPSPKIRKSRFTRILSYGKYVILAVLVIVIPLWKLAPGFCKYICPAGTFEAGLPLTLKNPQLRELAGVLFSWKVMLLTLIVILCVVCFRAFCRFLCPLGAIYSFFHPVSVFGVRVDPKLCTHCDACVRHCPMDIRKIGDRECIHCGSCTEVCPTEAIHFGIKETKKGTYTLAENEGVATTAANAAPTMENMQTSAASSSGKTVATRRNIRLITRIILLALTVFLIWYGLSHGGWNDLKNKAIRVCYECIGIG